MAKENTVTPPAMDPRPRVLSPFTAAARRLIDYSRGSDRLVGLDVARGLAVLGMIGAHVLNVGKFRWDRPDTWLDVIHGNSSVLFTVLAGLSVAIITRRGVEKGGIDLLQTRLRLVTRAILVLAAGATLAAVTQYPNILVIYATLFICAVPLIGWRPSRLIGLAGGVFLIGSIVVYFAKLWLSPSDEPYLSYGLADVMFMGSFPVVFWFGFLLVGLAIGRMPLASVRFQVILMAVGIACSIVGDQLAALARSFIELSGFDSATQDMLLTLSSSGAYNRSTTEAIASGGFAAAVLGACLLLTNVRLVRLVAFPIAAVGSMALTAYFGHDIVMDFSEGWGNYTDDPGVYGILVLWIMAACSAWWIVVGRGPIEYLVTQGSRWAARLPAVRSSSAQTSSNSDQHFSTTDVTPSPAYSRRLR